MNEFKNIICSVSDDMLKSFFAIYNDVLQKVPTNSPAYHTFESMIDCIKDEMRLRGINYKNGYVSQSDKIKAIKYLNDHNINTGVQEKYREDNDGKLGFFDGFLGFVGLLLVIFVIGILKMTFEGLASLWNKGILQVIIGALGIGTVTYLGYKSELFEKAKEKFNEWNSQKKKTSHNKKTVNIKSKSKTNIGKVTVNVIKNLTIYSSVLTVLTVGGAHINKHCDAIDGTVVEEITDVPRFVYEIIDRVIREKRFELFNDYAEFEKLGYMNYNYYTYLNNPNDLNNQKIDAWTKIDEYVTWEDVSYYAYGDICFANKLKLYNAYYDINNDTVEKGTMIFVPSLERLEKYIESKKMIKKL